MRGTLSHDLLAASELMVGFVIVMLTLAALWGLTELLGGIVRRLERAAATAKLAPSTTGQAAAADAIAPATAAASSSEEETAVIAAAVALVLDAPHRVVSVQTARSAWGQQGRRAIHDSRRMR